MKKLIITISLILLLVASCFSVQKTERNKQLLANTEATSSEYEPGSCFSTEATSNKMTAKSIWREMQEFEYVPSTFWVSRYENYEERWQNLSKKIMEIDKALMFFSTRISLLDSDTNNLWGGINRTRESLKKYKESSEEATNILYGVVHDLEKRIEKLEQKNLTK